MRDNELKNMCHEINEFVSIEINKKSFFVSFYLVSITFMCYAIEYTLSKILKDYYTNTDKLFITILDIPSLKLNCAIASAAMTVSILFTIFKVPNIFRFGIKDTDVVFPVLSIFYICFILSVVSFAFGYYECYYIIFYLIIILFINLFIIIYRMTKRSIIDKTLPRYRRILLSINSIILSISMVVFFLKDVNISS